MKLATTVTIVTKVTVVTVVTVDIPTFRIRNRHYLGFGRPWVWSVLALFVSGLRKELLGFKGIGFKWVDFLPAQGRSV